MQQPARSGAEPASPRSRCGKRAAVPLLALLALVVAAFAAPLAKAVPSESPLATWVANGSVEATAKSGDTLYLGGDFSRLAPRTGPAAAFDATTAKIASTPLLSTSSGGEIEAVEADGEGGYYVGGHFRHALGEPHQGIVHVLADGSIDPNFALELHERVKAIALDGDVLYVGGRVFEIDGEKRKWLAAFDADTGELLPWAPEANNEIHALAAHGGYVYIGGKFTSVNGEGRFRLASIQAAETGEGEGDVTAWNPTATSEVFTLVVSGSTLYTGGKFSELEAKEHKYLGAFDLATSESGEPDLTEWAPVPSNYVMAVAVSEDGETVYAGGEFTQMNGKAHNHIAAVKASDGSVVEAWVADCNYKVRDLAVSGSTVYAAGDFNQVNSESRRGLVAFDGEGVGSLLAWNPELLGSAHTVAVSGANVVAGGFFSGAGGVERQNLGAIDLTSGEPTSWAPEANNGVESLALSGDGEILYVGGGFTEIGGQARSRLAAVKTADGAPTGWSPNPNNSVKALVRDGSRLYVGGEFPSIAGKSFPRLAAFDLEGEGGELDEAWKPAPNNGVEGLAVDDEFLYVGGYFSAIGGQSRSNIAAVDKTSGLASATWDPSPNNRVETLVVSGSTLYAGGRFTSVDGEPRQRLAQFDSEGNLTAWAPEVADRVRGIAVEGSTVYAGGHFQSAGGTARRHLAAFDATSGALLPWNPGARDRVHHVELAGSMLIVGGPFRWLEYAPQTGFAVFTEPTLTVARSGAGTGAVSSEPVGIDCGTTCESGFAAGEEVTLTATADAGSEFIGWSGGGCSGTAPCVVTLNADTNVTAKFGVASASEEPGGGGKGSGRGSGGGTPGAGGGEAARDGTAGAWINTKIKRAKIGKPSRRTAGFWFATRGTEAAERFQCSLVKWPTSKNVEKRLKRKKIHFRPCGPRKRIYKHLQPGRYTFRVRVVGPTTWDRTAAKRQFRIR